MTTNRIILEDEPRNYFTMIPNLIYEIKLSSHAQSLYSSIRRSTGESGTCTRSTRTLARNAGCSIGSISAAKKRLQAAGLIHITSVECARGGRRHIITVPSIWRLNEKFFHLVKEKRLILPLPGRTYSIKQIEDLIERSAGERQRSAGERQRSAGERRKNHVRRPNIDNNNRDGENVVVVDGWELSIQFNSEQLVAFDELLSWGVRPQRAAELVEQHKAGLGRIQNWVDYTEQLIVRERQVIDNPAGFIIAGLGSEAAPLPSGKPYRYNNDKGGNDERAIERGAGDGDRAEQVATPAEV